MAAFSSDATDPSGHRCFDPCAQVRRVEIDVDVHDLEPPDSIVDDIAFVVPVDQPAGLAPAVDADGGRHDKPPFARCLPRTRDVDDRVHDQMGGKRDLAGGSPEKTPDGIAPDMAAEQFAVPYAVL